jgi:peptidoglycan/LPS O-acetylase OafA/YrhL
VPQKSKQLGCLAAILLASRKDQLTKWFQKYGPPIFSVSLGLVLIPYCLKFWWGIQALGFTLLLLHSVLFPDWVFYRFLNFKWLNGIGVLSYSLYIWQQLVFGLWPGFLDPVWFLWLPSVLGIAWISYEFLEKPFIWLRVRFHDPTMKISTAVRSQNL